MGNFDNYYIDGNGNAHRDIPLGTSPADAYVRTNMKLKKEVARIDKKIETIENSVHESVEQLTTDLTELTQNSTSLISNTAESISGYVDSKILSITNSLNTAEQMLNSRINTIVANDSSTEQNSELIDIRNGADTGVYASAGHAIRSQLARNNATLLQHTGHSNLFDKTKFTPNCEFKASTRTVIPNSNGYGLSDFIPVLSGKTLYFSRNGTAANATYTYAFDADHAYVDASMVNNETTYAVPATANYIRVCIKNNTIDDFQIEYDSVTAFKEFADLGILSNSIKSVTDRITSLETSAASTAETINSILSQNNSPNPLSHIEESPGLISCFLNVGCIGDSLASGVAVYKDQNGNTVVNSVNRYPYSWGQYLHRMTGNTYYNWSAGGLRTDSWLNSDYARECFDGNHLCQAYIIGLGQNDNNKYHGSDLGTISDVDIENYYNNANSFYGRYAKIIQKILEIQPKAKIFVLTDPNDSVNTNGYNTAIRNIANLFDNVYLLDMRTYWSGASCAQLLESQKRYGHYNAVGYFLIAKIIMTYIDHVMESNYEDFREIENIGTNFYWYE